MVTLHYFFQIHLLKRDFSCSNGTTGKEMTFVCWPVQLYIFFDLLVTLLSRSPPNCRSSPYLKRCFFRSSTYLGIFIGLFSSYVRPIGLLFFTPSMAIGRMQTFCVFKFCHSLCLTDELQKQRNRS